jgi:hypothetical protein
MDAADRLRALAGPQAEVLSHDQYDIRMLSTRVRKRT